MAESITKINDLTDVFSPKDMLAYQPQSVVSREIMRKPSGTITIFAFDRGEGLSEHTAPFDALVHILEGEAEITIDHRPHVVRAGEMLIMPANKPHALTALTPYKMLLMMIK